jgi:phosphate transport system protein
MREVFHGELDHITKQLVDMTRHAGSAMSQATTALLDGDPVLARGVIDADADLDRLRHDLEAAAVDLLALQQPVATDLRVVVTALRMGTDVERMGDLARHVAKVAALRAPAVAVPASVRPTIVAMQQVAALMVAKLESIVATHDVAAALALEVEDDAMDDLHRRLLAELVVADLPTLTVVDLTLLGRFYERFADHAVSVARRVVYLVTGEYHTEAELDQ